MVGRVRDSQRLVAEIERALNRTALMHKNRRYASENKGICRFEDCGASGRVNPRDIESLANIRALPNRIGRRSQKPNASARCVIGLGWMLQPRAELQSR